MKDVHDTRVKERVEDIFRYRVKHELGCTPESVGPFHVSRCLIPADRMAAEVLGE